VVHEGLIYAVNQNGTFSVLEAATGALLYSRNLGLGGTFYPSPTLAGARLFVASDNGQVVVLAPGREYKELSRFNFEPFRSTPVFSGTRVFLRTLGGLVCLGK
jgi:outer membrane protein assembly factor BamB